MNITKYRLNYGDSIQLRDRRREMTNKISRCKTCGKFFDSKRELREHIDKDHRITGSKIVSWTQGADRNNNNNNND